MLELLNVFGHVTANMVRREAFDLARERREGETDDDICKRIMHVGGDDWLTAIRKRHPVLRNVKKRRPIEIERAMKNQPEVTLQHWRLLAHT